MATVPTTIPIMRLALLSSGEELLRGLEFEEESASVVMIGRAVVMVIGALIQNEINNENKF